MSDIQDEKLEAMLRARRLEPAGPELAERIILKARSTPQNQTLPLGQWVMRLFAEFHLPKPAFVLASALVLGLVVGFNAPLDSTPDDADNAQVQSFLSADEDVL